MAGRSWWSSAPRQTAATGDDAPAVESVDAWVLKVEEIEAGAGRDGGVVVSVVVPRDEASEVAAAASEERLSIVALEE